MKFKVKLCGITRSDDLKIAIKSGFSAVGMIHFQPSPRHVSGSSMLALKKYLSANVQLFLVVVNEPIDSLITIANDLKPDVIQLHGEEDLDYLRTIRNELDSVGLVKAIRVKNQNLQSDCEAIDDLVDGFLFDTYRKNQAGGTGEVFDWQQLNFLKLNKPYILSGGLSVSNLDTIVCSAVNWHQLPLGLDYNSGLELAPGIKCVDKISKLTQKMNRLGLHHRGTII
tara:strand:+ start:5132 stop:5809 length:678 start_codon:yes stop_codon:yes gene_type:complete